MFERMFGSEFAAASDGELVVAIEDGVRAEAIAAARRLAAIAELTRRRLSPDDERDRWAFDPWDCTAAEVAAAMVIPQRRASGQMRIAQALRERLPMVAALFGKGDLSARLVSAITWGTHLVDDEAALTAVDAAIAERAVRWERLSEDKLREAVNTQVARCDPDAVRRTDAVLRGRDFVVGSCGDDAQTTAVWGRLQAHHGAVLKQRLAAMIAAVCDKDPRSAGERRADALGAIANGDTALACLCGSAHCPAAANPQTSNFVVHMIADQAAVADAHNALAAAHSAAAAAADPAPAAAPAPAASGPAAERRPRPAGPALLLGRGMLPNALLADAIRAGAVITSIRMPGVEPEPHYRPSAGLAEFVRMRDLFCRFPGCPVSAIYCDIDHVRPWPWGLTHPSGLNCICRGHHLMKTFYTGPGGWSDDQLPDATVIWTAPSGKTYTTQPGSRLFFPAWDVTTADLPPPTTPPPPLTIGRGLMMPRRQHTRAAAMAAAIQAERDLNKRDIPPF